MVVKTGYTLTFDGWSTAELYFEQGKILVEPGATFNCWGWIIELGSLEINGIMWCSSIMGDGSGLGPVEL